MGATGFSLGSTSTRPAKEPHSAASRRKNRTRSSRRAPSLRVPPGKIIKAQRMLIEGHSQREVGRALHMSAHTVAKVIKTEDFVDHIRQMQERLFAIAPDALASFHTQVKMDGRLAYLFLKDLQIIPTREALVQFLNAATPTESGAERQARLIGSVLFEAHERMGVPLGPEIEQALAKDAQKASETLPDFGGLRS